MQAACIAESGLLWWAAPPLGAGLTAAVVTAWEGGREGGQEGEGVEGSRVDSRVCFGGGGPGTQVCQVCQV